MKLEPLVGARGYTPARRLIGTRDDGSTVFVKEAVDGATRRWLAMERRAYESLGPHPWLPAYLGPDGDDRIVLEDLRDGRWPPPWQPGDVARVLDVLDVIGATTAPAWCTPVSETRGGLRRWIVQAEDPSALLAIGVTTRSWLDDALPVLLEAEAAAVLDGRGIAHLDVRSDNLCFVDDERVVLVDWNLLCRAAPGVDATFFLATVALETGEPPPDHDPALVAVVAGCFAEWVSLPTLPRVAEHRLAMLRVALPWAARLLGLRPPS